MDPGLLSEPPFIDTHPEGLDGIFGDAEADNIVSIIGSFNQSVDVDSAILILTAGAVLARLRRASTAPAM
jgi:type I restriction enzyme R subunit